jgi:hypothetical protein
VREAQLPKTTFASGKRKLDNRMKFLRFAPALTLLFGGAALWADSAPAQEINFDQINKFESLGTGTLHVGAPPKTIVDDGQRHVVILTIWDANAETKVYWRSPNGDDARTTVIPGKGIQTFQTAGEFRLEPSANQIGRLNMDTSCLA